MLNLFCTITKNANFNVGDTHKPPLIKRMPLNNTCMEKYIHWYLQQDISIRYKCQSPAQPIP